MRPKPSRPQAVERLVLRRGFLHIRSSGSHRFYRHADGRIVVIAFHPGDIPSGTLRAIISHLGMTVKQFNESV